MHSPRYLTRQTTAAMLPSRPAGRGGCTRPPRDRRVSLGSQLFLHLALRPVGLNPQTLAAHQQLTESQRGCAGRTLTSLSTPRSFNFAALPLPPGGCQLGWLLTMQAGGAELGCTCCPRTSHPRLASPAANSAISPEPCKACQAPLAMLLQPHSLSLCLTCSSAPFMKSAEWSEGRMKGCSVPFTSLWLLGLHRPILLQTNEGLGNVTLTFGIGF